MFFKIKIIIALLFVLGYLMPDSVRGQSTRGIDIEDPASEKALDHSISLTLNRVDWSYKLGEEAVFSVEVIDGEGATLPSGEVYYTIGPEKMPSTKNGKVDIRNGKAEIRSEGMHEPGFLRCNISINIFAKKYSATATAAYEPEAIKPIGVTPNDFNQFWFSAIKQSKTVPLNTRMTPILKSSSDSVEVYQVEYEFYSDSVQKFYGVLSIPKATGKYPAIIRFPGAGWAPMSGDQKNSAKGFITLDLYIHGHPVTKSITYYESLKVNELKDYMYIGVKDRDLFYFKNVILGCVRSIDLIYSLPQFDSDNIVVWGSSQGGALSIITTSLEPRIDKFVALCPSMCDFPGMLNGRAGGWPHFFARQELYEDNTEQVLNTLSYYDVVNFAKNLKTPGYFSWGFNDITTPPTSFYTAYNLVSSPKQLFIIPNGVHKVYPEQIKRTYEWLLENLK